MNNQRKLSTVSIGIPVHNEEANIVYLLNSIFKQKQKSYKIEKIYVVADNCTDATEEKVKKVAKSHKNIVFLNDGKHIGKANRLSQLYNLSKSDYVLTLDGDIVFRGTNDIEAMVTVMRNNSQIVVASARQMPVLSGNSFVAKVAYTNYLLWNEVKAHMKNKDNVYNLMASATLVRKAFSKKVLYPKTITCDEGYLFVLAKSKNGFAFVDDAVIYQRSAATLKDFRFSCSRSISERQDLVRIFGETVLENYKVPMQDKMFGMAKMFFHRPVYTIAAIGLTYFTRFFPINDSLQKKGLWQTVSSTKQAIIH